MGGHERIARDGAPLPIVRLISVVDLSYVCATGARHISVRFARCTDPSGCPSVAATSSLYGDAGASRYPTEHRGRTRRWARSTPHMGSH